ncbi:hypothetical protein [Streptomyces flaveolus]
MTASPSTARPPVTEDSAPASPPVLTHALSRVAAHAAAFPLHADLDGNAG